jgi:hypothetical protein
MGSDENSRSSGFPVSLNLSASKSESEYSVRFASTFEELQELRALWEDLNQYPNTELDFFNLINRQRPSVKGPKVLVIEKANKPVGLVVGRLVVQDFLCRFGYKTVKLARTTEYHIINGGLLNCPGTQESEVILNALLAALKLGDMDLVYVSHVNINSHLYDLLLTRPPFFCRDRLVRSKLHWTTQLPKSAAEVVQRLSKKRRHWIRSLEKQVEKDFPEQVAFREFVGLDSLGEVFQALETIAKKTYQRGLGVGFVNDDDFKERMRFEAAKGWLRTYILYVKGQPVAFWVGYLYKNVFHSGMTGYDPHYRDYGVGSLVFIRMIDSLCKAEVASVDFGLGDALYKQRFGDRSWSEANVRIFAPTLRAMALNLTQTVFDGSINGVRSILERTGMLQRLKTLWRRRLEHEEE